MTMHNGTISEAAAAAWGVASGAPETQDIHVWIMLKDGSMDLDSRILTNQWRQTGHKRSVFPRYSCRVKRRRDFIVSIPFLSNSLKMKKPGHLRSLGFPKQAPRQIIFFYCKTNCRCKDPILACWPNSTSVSILCAQRTAKTAHEIPISFADSSTSHHN